MTNATASYGRHQRAEAFTGAEPCRADQKRTNNITTRLHGSGIRRGSLRHLLSKRKIAQGVSTAGVPQTHSGPGLPIATSAEGGMAEDLLGPGGSQVGVEA
jgi:hypothetical protein